MTENQKTIMILGAGQLQVPIIQRARERGLNVVVVSPSLNQPGIQYADAVVQLDVKDEEGILEAAKRYQIDGITTDQTDLPVRTAAYVAGKMGLPGISYEMGRLFTDKYLQREKCREIGIETVAYHLAESVDDAVAFAKKIGFPLIIKPIDSQASHGVSKVTSEDELRSCWGDAVRFSRNGGVLIEQYIEGIEFSIDSYVIDGKCYVLSMGQYHPFAIKDVFSSYKTIFPANQPQEILNLLKETNKNIVEGFGIDKGRTHAEYIISNNKCYLVEIGARGGGAFFSSDNVRFVTGISSEDFLIDTAFGSREHPAVNECDKCFCCCTLFFYLPADGEVVEINGIEQVLNLDFVARNNLDQIQIGIKTNPLEDKAARYFLVIKADSYEQLDERVKYMREMLKIKTKVADGRCLLPIWF